MLTAKPALTLKQFMQRQQVLNLYRRILRAIKEIPDAQQRIELKTWAKDDFKTNMHQTDEISIKLLVTYGERCLKELSTSINLAK